MKKVSFRTEQDFLGVKEIPEDKLFGIHSLRASENFPDTSSFNIEWYKCVGTVKKACYKTSASFFKKIKKRANIDKINIKHISPDISEALIVSASEIESGMHFQDFIIPAVSGGAGTSINMNVNEIIANRSLQLINNVPGNYSVIDPVEHCNIFQSTNDVIPTALKLAGLKLLSSLEVSVNNLRFGIEKLEKKHATHLRKGYTQMQEAVPSSFGRLFGTYSDTLSRDWWRISKCKERIKSVNLGGGAIGTGIGIPRFFIMEVVQQLKELTGLPVTRAENLCDATNNLDSYVEIHGILKAHAVNLEKIVSDIRLLASDVNKTNEIEIPKKQTGSSIMPGKVNPVVVEYVISCAHKIYSNDSLVTSLCALGCLELNAYLPVIGNALLESLNLLVGCNQTLEKNLIKGLKVNHTTALTDLFKSPSITVVLIPLIGYNYAGELSNYMKTNKCSVHDANKELQIMNPNKLENILKPENLLKKGFVINDILDLNDDKG